MIFMYLTEDEHTILTAFVARSRPGTPYWRRVQVLLAYDEKTPPADIARQIDWSVAQTRKLINLFKKERLAIFPNWVVVPPPLFTADDTLTDAGRAFFKAQLNTIHKYRDAVQNEASEKGIHETRKAMRRMRTVFKWLEPYFPPDTVRVYRKRFKKTMGRLGPARDVAVFIKKLKRHIDKNPAQAEPLTALRDYWAGKKLEAEQAAQVSVGKKKHAKLIARFEGFVEREGEVDPAGDTPSLVRHVAPILIYQRLATVRAYDGQLDTATIEKMHELRIHFKELRYTLEFFEPVLGTEIQALLKGLNGIQDDLGDLNDADVALNLLQQVPDDGLLGEGVALYRTTKEAEIEQLRDNFAGVWADFNTAQWREQLAKALLVL